VVRGLSALTALDPRLHARSRSATFFQIARTPRGTKNVNPFRQRPVRRRSAFYRHRHGGRHIRRRRCDESQCGIADAELRPRSCPMITVAARSQAGADERDACSQKKKKKPMLPGGGTRGGQPRPRYGARRLTRNRDRKPAGHVNGDRFASPRVPEGRTLSHPNVFRRRYGDHLRDRCNGWIGRDANAMSVAPLLPGSMEKFNPPYARPLQQ